MVIFQKKKKIDNNFKKTVLPAEKEIVSAEQSSGGFILLLKQPWITEKSNNMTELRKYVFLVDKKANKSEISKNVEATYNVKVSSVNIINIKGKIKKMKTKTGKTPGFKKMIITLKEGYKIETISV